MMRTGWLTGILLAVSVIVLVAVPPVRQAAVEAYRTYNLPGTRPLPTRREYEKIALAHPQNAAIWLGFAQAIDADLAKISRAHVPDWDEGSTWTATQAYEQAILISPRSPAPYLRYALRLLGNSGPLYPVEEYGAERQQYLPRTPEQIANLRQAEGLLKQAGRLDPENAACDYLLAYAYLAQHEEWQVVPTLEAAISKPHWNTADAEAATGLLRLMEAAGMPGTLAPGVAMALHDVNFPVGARLKALVRTLVGFGEQFRAQGRHQEAIVYYEAAVHLGHITRADAYSMIDGLVAVAITAMTSGPFLSEEQERQIEKDTPITEDEAKLSPEAKMTVMMGYTKHRASVPEEQWDPAERWWHQTQERSQRMQEARVANFAAYLTQHGRGDVAAFYEADVQAATKWKENATATIKQLVPWLITSLFGGGMLNAWGIWIHAAAMFWLWIIVGIISLAILYRRERWRPPSWSYWQWLLLLGVCVVPGQITATVLAVRMVRLPVSVWNTEYFYMGVGVAAGIGVVAWLIVALFLALRKRARQTAEQRLGKARTYLASLRTLLPPTFAALLLLSVIALWPAHRSLQKWANEQRVMIEQGEVKYWGIGEDDGQDIG